ncbi:hypothetical protein TPAR_04109, partial [Tolypocladium paradoxum]
LRCPCRRSGLEPRRGVGQAAGQPGQPVHPQNGQADEVNQRTARGEETTTRLYQAPTSLNLQLKLCTPALLYPTHTSCPGPRSPSAPLAQDRTSKKALDCNLYLPDIDFGPTYPTHIILRRRFWPRRPWYPGRLLITYSVRTPAPIAELPRSSCGAAAATAASSFAPHPALRPFAHSTNTTSLLVILELLLRYTPRAYHLGAQRAHDLARQPSVSNPCCIFNRD